MAAGRAVCASQNQGIADRNLAQARKIRCRLVERLSPLEQNQWRSKTECELPEPAPHMNGRFYHAQRKKWQTYRMVGAQAAIAPLRRDLERLERNQRSQR